MNNNSRFTVTVALIAALGGFLMGFDASVISGVVGFIETEFSLSKIQLGWSVASLTLTATLAMLLAGPLSDRLGRRPVLRIAAILFALSAIASAVAPNFISLVLARMLGGFGVGAALIIAPMYIAEIAPAKQRGRMVSFNQLNIVIGISAAFFSNYLILTLGQSEAGWAQALHFGDWGWRWMLGIETVPAIVYFFALMFVPESPRWLAMQGREEDALQILTRVSGAEQATADLQQIHDSIAAEAELNLNSTDHLPESASMLNRLRQLFHPSMKLVMTIGISIAILQQITGINSVFFYAPMIFEQSGIGTDAAFLQAVLVGLVNLLFTILAMSIIDKVGRRPLLGVGLAGIAAAMLTLSYGFGSATYTLTEQSVDALPATIDHSLLTPLVDQTFHSDVEFRNAVSAAIGQENYQQIESALVSNAISMQPLLILLAILAFVASFAMSLGPVMWVLFSELFPNKLRGLAISFVGLINSGVSFAVQLIFPWELETLGNSRTFLIYGLFAVIGLIIVLRILPETKGKSLEELESLLVKKQ